MLWVRFRLMCKTIFTILGLWYIENKLFSDLLEMTTIVIMSKYNYKKKHTKNIFMH